MSEPDPLLSRKARRPLDNKPAMAMGQNSVVLRGGLVLYALAAIVFAGIAIYFGAVRHMPLTSGYVAAPAIGAAWFALRLFMMMAPKR